MYLAKSSYKTISVQCILQDHLARLFHSCITIFASMCKNLASFSRKRPYLLLFLHFLQEKQDIVKIIQDCAYKNLHVNLHELAAIFYLGISLAQALSLPLDFPDFFLMCLCYKILHAATWPLFFANFAYYTWMHTQYLVFPRSSAGITENYTLASINSSTARNSTREQQYIRCGKIYIAIKRKFWTGLV